MGTAIQLPAGASLASQATGFALDAGSDDTFINYFAPESVMTRNLGGQRVASTVTGSPAVSDPWVTVDETAYITTAAAKPSGDWTWFLVGRLSTLSNASYMMGNLAATAGISLIHLSGQPSRISVGARVSGGSYVSFTTATAALAAGVPFCICARYDQSTLTMDVTNMTNGVTGSNTFASDLAVTSSPVMFGTTPTGSASENVDIAAAMMFDSRVSDTERSAIYAQLKRGMAVDGVSI